jgi:hypothetical protein
MMTNLTGDQRRALTLLTETPQGLVEAALIDAHGFRLQTIVDLIRVGYAHADVKSVRAGNRNLKIARVAITEAGRLAIAS